MMVSLRSLRELRDSVKACFLALVVGLGYYAVNGWLGRFSLGRSCPDGTLTAIVVIIGGRARDAQKQ